MLILLLLSVPKIGAVFNQIEDCIYIGTYLPRKMRSKFTMVHQPYYHHQVATSFN
jgi:hypothetical protein